MMVNPICPPALGVKLYQVPWRSVFKRQPAEVNDRSAMFPVLFVLLLMDWLLQMVMLPMQSSGGAGGGLQVTVAA